LGNRLTFSPAFDNLWMNRRYGGWFLTSVSGVVLSARNRNGQRHLFQKKSKARFPFCLQSKSKGGEVMVVKQEDLLGVIHPETEELFCLQCWERFGLSIFCSCYLLTADKAEDDRLYFCDGCTGLILET
jgi:hypothetical protein